MASGNDPANVAYVVQENGFWYVAYKEKVKVPNVIVSAKGVANGLSEEYNDGWDFGPDSYNPSVTSGVPLTQTCGIQEAVNYVNSTNFNINFTTPTIPGSMTIHLASGGFVVNSDITIPTGTGVPPESLTLRFTGEGRYNSTILLANGIKGFVGTIAYTLLFRDISFVPNGSSATPVSAINLSANGTSTTENFNFENCTFTNEYPGTTYSLGAVVLNNVSARSVFFTGCHFNINGGYGIYATATGSLNTMITVENDTPVNTPFYFNGVNTIALRNLNTYSASFTVGSCNKLIMDNVNYYDASGPLIMLLGSVYSLVIKNSICVQVSGSSFTDWIALASGVSSGIIYKCQLENVFTSFGTSNVNFIGAGVSLYVLRPNPNVFNNIFNGNTYSLILPTFGALSTNPPVSATVYQNTNPYDIEIDLPVYATTAGTAGYVTLAKGTTSTPASMGNQYVNGATSSTSVDIIRLRVPARWYFSFTASGVTLGTATVFAD